MTMSGRNSAAPRFAESSRGSIDALRVKHGQRAPAGRFGLRRHRRALRAAVRLARRRADRRRGPPCPVDVPRAHRPRRGRALAGVGAALAACRTKRGRGVTRTERRWHLLAWRALGPLILIGLLAALRARPPLPISGPVARPADRPLATREPSSATAEHAP